MSQELEGTLTNSANLVGNFGSEGGGGTSNYNDLINKPSINSVTLQGNKTASQLGFAEVATSGNYDDLNNKPTIPAAQVNSDWNATSGVAEILNKPTLSAVATSGDYDDLTNKPTIPAAQVNSDWNAISGVAEILNKPTIPAAQVNSDWNSTSGVSEILNKPTVYQNAAALPISANDSTDTKTYIDNVVTSGSNANGNYIKYKDGTMICTKSESIEILQTQWVAWGSMQNVGGVSVGSWAETFYSTPIVNATISGDSAWLEKITNFTTTSCGTVGFVRPNNPARTTNFNVQIIGIGRWKA